MSTNGLTILYPARIGHGPQEVPLVPDTANEIRQHDAADCRQLARAVETILPALTKFNTFEGPDDGARRRHEWMAVIDRPLPETGLGLDGVLAELNRLIPYGLRNGHPGFSGYID